MVDFGGWDMPVEYSGLTAEHLAVRTGVGVFDVSHMGDIQLRGPNSLAAVQKLLMNDASKLQTGTEGVFAAGDVAEYESVVHGGRRIRVEHWDVAFNQGRHVAAAMLGSDRPYDVVPYFFSDLSDWAAIEYVGPALEWDREVIRGSLDDGKFTVFYLQDGRVAGALTVGRSDDLQHARRFLAEHTEIGDRAEALGDLSTDLETL